MTRWRVPLLLFTGSLLLQIAWISALPPFRGIDEFDHAYRAAEVAHGQWIGSYKPAKHGRGELVTVPRDIVVAATPVCETYKYVGPDNCLPVRSLGSGMVTVASAASRYNPFFYWLIGTIARPFRGASALYAMRLTAAVLCSAMFALAGGALERWRKPRWALLPLFAAMTPMAVYSTALPAPNGLEMVSGLAVWACLLGLPQVQPSERRGLLYLATAAAVILATVRSLGPLWLALILVTCVGALGIRSTRLVVQRHRSLLMVSTGLVAVATLAGALWTLTQATNSPILASAPKRTPSPLPNLLREAPLWLFQAMGAFPTRNEPAPTELYVTFTLIFLAVACVVLWRGAVRIRWGFAATCFFSYTIPGLLVLLTFSRLGDAWQGRYTLPYSIGIPLFAGIALSRRSITHRLMPPLLVVGWLAVASAHVAGVMRVLTTESTTSPLVGSSEWTVPPGWLVISLTVSGLLAWAGAIFKAGRFRYPSGILNRGNPLHLGYVEDSRTDPIAGDSDTARARSSEAPAP